MKPHNGKPPSQQGGFSLIEIMVGLAIGLLATLVIVQVISDFESQKRVTTGTADAQTNGSITLHSIGRDVRMASYALLPTGSPGVPDSPLECATLTENGVAVDPAVNLSPVTIVDGGPGGSDTITMRSGNSPRGGTPSVISGPPIGNVVTVANNFGCETGDTTLIISGNICAISSASAVSATINTSITLQNVTGVVAGANLACLGTWSVITYSVVNGNLNITTNGGVPAPDMAGIVDLQAQYGISATGNSNAIVQWVDATGAWAAPTVADRNRIKAVRLAVVARNPKREAIAVTTVCTNADTPGLSGLCAWQGNAVSPAPAINLAANDADWLRYRYRVFETILPLRNVVWAGGPKGTL